VRARVVPLDSTLQFDEHSTDETGLMLLFFVAEIDLT
jgi:hypothetical protein